MGAVVTAKILLQAAPCRRDHHRRPTIGRSTRARIYAGQRPRATVSSGSRAGFFVGDGTGVGKGSILAGIIADNFNQGRKRVVWLSVNNDLLESDPPRPH